MNDIYKPLPASFHRSSAITASTANRLAVSVGCRFSTATKYLQMNQDPLCDIRHSYSANQASDSALSRYGGDHTMEYDITVSILTLAGFYVGSSLF